MATTIQLSNELKDVLNSRRVYDKETYEEVIWNLLEDLEDLSQSTLERIKISEKEIENNETISLNSIKKKYDLN